jgi:hypothetical protein
MGLGRHDAHDWSAYASTARATPMSAKFASRVLHEDLDPSKIALRESRDSDLNPESTAIIIAADVTGSMGVLSDQLVNDAIGKLFEELLKRRPVTDPQMLCMGVGDAAANDRAPLQVTQFETEGPILAEQLKKVWLEKGGGSNSCESYTLPWLFAAQKTSIDCYEKRGKKGYLITIGDEECPKVLTVGEVNRVMGGGLQADAKTEDLLKLVSQNYHVFHLMVTEGSHMRYHHKEVVDSWTSVLGQRAIPLTDIAALGEVIVSAIQVNEGADKDAVIKSWSGSTAVAVRDAVTAMIKKEPEAADTGVSRL